MGYQIRYDAIGIQNRKGRDKLRGWIASICVLLLIAGAITVKTVGLTWVQEVLLPGDPDVTAAALEGMVEDLRQGDSLGQAIRAFCEEIIANGQLPE